jgi:Flp pilus assembly pilin Flp
MNFYVLTTWLKARARRDETGANLVEYILLVALIALLVIAAVWGLKEAISGRFDDASECLNDSANSTGQNC